MTGTYRSVQHVAAVSPNEDILRLFLSYGASVHIRNRAGHTPLFIAAHAGQLRSVELLTEAGAHLHNEELPDARHLAKRAANSGQEGVQGRTDSLSPQAIWEKAGVDLNKR